MLYIVIIVSVLIAAWLGWEIHHAPLIEDENTNIDHDPTTDIWHDEDHHPDQQI
jgi:hypothetical protein